VLSIPGEGGIASSSASTSGDIDAAPSPVSSLRSDSTVEAPDASLWEAVTQGNLAKLEEMTAKGLLSSGRMLDANGHSIMWNAIAFQQPQIALFLLQRFPPGLGASGIDLSEVHAKRGDTLLHLCLYINEFSVHAADVFQRIFQGCKAMHEVVNHDGQSFLHVAFAGFFVFSQSLRS